MRVIVVEDNAELAEALCTILRAEGHTVDLAASGEEAQAALAVDAVDLVVLDLGLPDIDGFEVLRGLRSRGNPAAVLVLSARGALDDRVKGLDLGADDYMAKPFEVDEFEARVRALLRRRAGSTRTVVEVGELVFDLDARRVSLNGQVLELPRRELDVLEILLTRTERIVPKQEIAAAIAGFDDEISDSAIELYISRLRRKLQPAGLEIRAFRGLGYMVEEA